VCGLVHAALALHWLPTTIALYVPTGPTSWWAFGAVIGLVVATAWLPVAIVAAITSRRLVVLWLPPALVTGERLETALLDFSWGQWLYSQWDCPQVLGVLARLGWFPTLLLALGACTCVGVGVARGRLRPAVPGLLAIAVAWCLPPLPHDPRPLAGIGVVALADIEQRPAAYPALDVLVWPEGTSRERPALEEGQPSSTRVLERLPGAPRVAHVLGLVASSVRGPINAAVVVDPAGVVLAARAKSSLVPGFERPVLGTSLSGTVFAAGRAPPALTIGGHVLVPLVCYEAFSRDVVAAGREAGGEVIVALSSDRPLHRSAAARRQILAALVLRAVEFRMPAVRSSMWGEAAIITADGRIVSHGPAGATDVLTAPTQRGHG
jgi:predicted amidohydrolase